MSINSKKSFTVKSVRKDIISKIKKIKTEYRDNKVEYTYLQKQAIKEYYEKNHRQIEDNVLVDIYNTIYNPSILVELAIGILSGISTTILCEIIKTSKPYDGDTVIELLGYCVAMAVIILVFFFIFLLMLRWSYKNISSLRSYSDEVEEYHKEIVYHYIQEREKEFEKRCQNEPKWKKKNRRNK